jgi:hypothetical protein
MEYDSSELAAWVDIIREVQGDLTSLSESLVTGTTALDTYSDALVTSALTDNDKI